MTTLVRSSLCLLVAAALTPSTGIFALEYVGSERCAQCHVEETEAWRGSHHELAMAEVSEETVLGDFNDTELTAHGVTSRFYRRDGSFFVRTDGPDGTLQDYPIRYTFGWYPLQQYLIEFPRGHLQSLGLAWDSRSPEEGGQRWFHLYPDEEMDYRHQLHWTGRDQTWNYQCAECHSTSLRKNYDVSSDSYDTTFEEINVACEACHGPGSKHLAWAETAAGNAARKMDLDKGLTVDLVDRDGAAWLVDADGGKPYRSKPRENHIQINLCARCHSRRGQIWADDEFGRALGNTHRLSLLEQHLYYPDGQIKDEVYVYGSFIQSAMHRAGVTCSDCHEPHGLGLRAEGNALCTRCHLSERYDTPDHHQHEAGSDGAACSACHMPQRVYMLHDWRADHSMRVPRPDLSSKLNTPNACNGCHEDRTSRWAADAVAAWFPDSPYRDQHFGEALHAAGKGLPDAGARLLSLASDPSQPAIARATALDALWDHAQPQHLPALAGLLGDDDPLIRGSAVRLLELTDVRTLIDNGWPLLNDPERVVRLEATRLLAPLLRQRIPEEHRLQLIQAVQEYRTAQNVNADRAESHLNLGSIAVAAGDLSRAERDYATAMRLDPAFTPAYVNLADLHRQQGNDADGEVVLRRGIEQVPDNADLQHALGLLLVRQKRLGDALPHLRRASLLAADQPRYAYVYALGLEGAGRVAQALAVLAQTNARHPGNREILTALVNMHRQQGNNERAQHYVDELTKQ